MSWFSDRGRRRTAPQLPAGSAGRDQTDPLPTVLGVAHGSAGVPVPVSRARTAAWMTENAFSYFVDNDGDVAGLWRGRLFYFFLFGEHSEMLQVRGQWQREAAIERLGEILEFCNEWNTERIWPKAYVRVRDNGRVHVLSEVAVDFEHGANDAQLSQTLFCGLSTGSSLFDALDAQYPDPVGSAP